MALKVTAVKGNLKLHHSGNSSYGGLPYKSDNYGDAFRELHRPSFFVRSLLKGLLDSRDCAVTLNFTVPATVSDIPVDKDRGYKLGVELAVVKNVVIDDAADITSSSIAAYSDDMLSLTMGFKNGALRIITFDYKTLQSIEAIDVKSALVADGDFNARLFASISPENDQIWNMETEYRKSPAPFTGPDMVSREAEVGRQAAFGWSIVNKTDTLCGFRVIRDRHELVHAVYSDEITERGSFVQNALTMLKDFGPLLLVQEDRQLRRFIPICELRDQLNQVTV